MMDGPMLRGGYVPHSEAVKPAVAPAARDHVMQTIGGQIKNALIIAQDVIGNTTAAIEVVVASGEEEGRVFHLGVDVEDARVNRRVVEAAIYRVSTVKHQIGIDAAQDTGDLLRIDA